MKSKFVEACPRAAVALLLGAWTAVALGGVSSTDLPESEEVKVVPSGDRQRPAGDRELAAVEVRGRDGRARAVMKCWQEGRLIFEELDWESAGAKDLGAGPVLRSHAGDYGRMQLMAFGETFCYLKHQPRHGRNDE